MGVGYERVILVVSTGTSDRESGELAVGAVERAFQQAFAGYGVRRAYASRRILEAMDAQGDCGPWGKGMYVTDALDRVFADGVKTVFVQPLFVFYGRAYNQLAAELQAYCLPADADGLVLGQPLVAQDTDMDVVAAVVCGRLRAYADKRTAVCLVCHGMQPAYASIYETMQRRLAENGYAHYYVGAVCGKPTQEDVLAKLKAHGAYQRVVLYPFMIAAGVHARRDIAGSGNGSWKCAMARAGYEVVCLMEGLGELPPVGGLFVGHVRRMIAGGLE